MSKSSRGYGESGPGKGGGFGCLRGRSRWAHCLSFFHRVAGSKIERRRLGGSVGCPAFCRWWPRTEPCAHVSDAKLIIHAVEKWDHSRIPFSFPVLLLGVPSLAAPTTHASACCCEDGGHPGFDDGFSGVSVNLTKTFGTFWAVLRW